LVGDGKAIVGQLNAALAGLQWFHPKDTPWRQMIAKKAEENAADYGDSLPHGSVRSILTRHPQS
jgi:hypothetical protein